MDKPIVVVGAGPTGLTAAANLARFGVPVRLVERATVPPDDRSRAAVVQPRTLELFDYLGIADEATTAGMFIDELELINPSGSRGSLQFVRPGWLDSRYKSLLSLPQDQTERILGALVERLGVSIERGVELVSLSQTDAFVAVRLRHADGALEDVEAEWVIGADGAHSTVRELSGLTFPGVTYRDEGLIGDIEVEWRMPHATVSLCPQAEGFLLVFPLPGERHFRTIMIVPNETMSEDRDLGLDEFRERLARMTPVGWGADGGPPRIVRANWLTRYRLHRRGVATYQTRRVFVAGDAAHIHSPVGAQGMNTGIQDAFNLTWKLALVSRREAPGWVVETYSEERHRIGELLLNGTDRAFGFVAGHGWFSRTLRRIAPTLGARALGIPWIARRLVRFVSQLEIKYPNSRLSTEGPGAPRLGRNAPCSGCRAPDVELQTSDGTTRTLFDELRGPAHVLLVFIGSSQPAIVSEIATTLKQRFAASIAVVGITTERHNTVPSLLFDVAGAAHARYGARDGAIYLVRPDGHIGFRGALSDTPALYHELERRLLTRVAPPPSTL